MNEAVARNIAGYTKRARSYDDLHPEIYNDIEQTRLRSFLTNAAGEIQSGGRDALDFGCGSGNLTRHLQAMGMRVTCTDVTPAFLELVRERFGVPTIELVGGEIDGLPDGAYDLIAMYSVIHHIPDYEDILLRLVAKLKPGGVLVIEHETHEHYYFPTPELAEYRRANHEATRGGWCDPEHKRWQYIVRAAVSPSRHVTRYRLWRGIPIEGDIHVHPHDHIEWPKVYAALEAGGAEGILRSDHLSYNEGDDLETWKAWKNRCFDYTALAAKRTYQGSGTNAGGT